MRIARPLSVLVLASAAVQAHALDLATPFQGSSIATARCAPLLAGTWSSPAALGAAAQSGQVVITEFLKDPSHVTDTRGEWIEVYNAMPWRVNLEGWILSDESGSQHVIQNGGLGVRMRPGEYLVLGLEADPALNGGVTVDYEYTGFSLGNGADTILLSKPDGTLVDRIAYDDGVTWPDSAGRSISLQIAARDVLSNDNGASWCHGLTPISGVNPDTGTPGLDNDACP